MLGAYARLSHAGLGCHDWPGCYYKPVMSGDEDWVTEANQLYPDRPLEHGKAWKEMVHRYAAGGLGLLILAMSVITWRNRKTTGLGLLVVLLTQFTLRPATMSALLFRTKYLLNQNGN
jgi:heme a synthase